MTKSPASPELSASLPAPKECRRLREARSLTQAQVAVEIGVTRETVRSWESGRTTPRGRKREAYARFLAQPATAPQQPTTEADPAPTPAPAPAPAAPRTAAEAFDALYTHSSPHLVRQTYLLTGRRTLARESVERAFQLAWQRWPEVAVDPDPSGWVRAAAYEYAMSPWHRMRRAHRHPEAPPADAADRELLDALLDLPVAYRRTLLLYDGVGLDLPETAAETEASTPAAANRILHAREAVAAQLPELAVPDQLHRRLTELAGAEKLDAPGSTVVRSGGERRVRLWTRAAIAATTLVIGATALTVRVAPTHYEPVPAPGSPISGVPPLTGPGRLTDDELRLRAQLRAHLAGGPERLTPRAE